MILAFSSGEVGKNHFRTMSFLSGGGGVVRSLLEQGPLSAYLMLCFSHFYPQGKVRANTDNSLLDKTPWDQLAIAVHCKVNLHNAIFVCDCHMQFL